MLQAHATVHPPTAGFGELGRAWSEAYVSAFPRGLWELGLAGKVSSARGYEPQGAPGMWFAHVDCQGRRTSRRGLTPASWGKFWADTRDKFTDVDILLSQLDEGGRAGGRPTYAFGIQVEDPDSVRGAFALSASEYLGRGVSAPWSERWLVEGLRSFVDGTPVAFAMVTPHGHMTGIEEGQRHYPHLARRHCRECLRGYEWVMVISEALAARLGGPSALAASGAFCVVDVVAGGSVFLQATHAFADYDLVAARRVFDAVRPVLPNRVLRRPMHDASASVDFEVTGALPDPAAPVNPSS